MFRESFDIRGLNLFYNVFIGSLGKFFRMFRLLYYVVDVISSFRCFMTYPNEEHSLCSADQSQSSCFIDNETLRLTSIQVFFYILVIKLFYSFYSTTKNFDEASKTNSKRVIRFLYLCIWIFCLSITNFRKQIFVTIEQSFIGGIKVAQHLFVH